MQSTGKAYIFGYILIFDTQNRHEKVKTLLNFLFPVLKFRLLFIFNHIQCMEKDSHVLWLMALMPYHQYVWKRCLD